MEALEDRWVPSNAAGSATNAISPVFSAVSVTAYAGDQLLAVVATVSTPSQTGVTAAIDLNDQVSAGGVANASSAPSGMPTSLPSGTYTLVVSVRASAGNPVQTPPKVTVTPAVVASSFAASITLTVQGSDGLPASGVALSISYVSLATINLPVLPQSPAQTPPVPNPTPVVQPSPSSSPTVVHLQLTVGIRAGATDFVSWSSTRDQGLTASMPGWPTVPGPDGLSPVNSNEYLVAREAISASSESATGMMQILITVFATSTSLPRGAPVVATEPSDANFPGQLSDAESLAVAEHDTSPEERRDGQAAEQQFYHQPLYRVADRSELGGSPGFRVFGLVTAAGSPAPTAELPAPGAEETENWQRLASSLAMPWSETGLSPTSERQALTPMDALITWTVFQALHRTESEKGERREWHEIKQLLSV